MSNELEHTPINLMALKRFSIHVNRNKLVSSALSSTNKMNEHNILVVVVVVVNMKFLQCLSTIEQLIRIKSIK